MASGSPASTNRSKASFATTATSASISEPASVGLSSTATDHNRCKPTATNVKASTECIYCNEFTHNIDSCKAILALPIPGRYEYLKTKGICFACLKSGHIKKKCKNKLSCASCNKYHPTILHDWNFSLKLNSARNNVVNSGNNESGTSMLKQVVNLCDDNGAGDLTCFMAIIPVKVRLRNKSQTVETYAFFDSGSNVSFCTESLLQKIGGHGKKMQVTLNTMGQPYRMQTYAVNGLQVSDFGLSNTIDLPRVYTKQEMPVSHQHIPTQEEIDRWPHLNGVKIPKINGEIGLMLGNNVPDAYSPLEFCTGPKGSPHATRTALGWIVWSLACPLKDRKVVASSTHPELLVNRAELTVYQEIEDTQRLERMVEQSINMDFPERLMDDKREHSKDDKHFLEVVTNSVEFKDGHYYIDLPFRKDVVKLPNNLNQAYKRLSSLKRKMTLLPEFKKDYIDFMDKIFEKGYAERVANEDLTNCNGLVWYIPHHGVYHPRKPTKLRVVFDCSATYMGTSLNSQLLPGPDLTNKLLGVLLKFREEAVAIAGDVEAMFYQVKVPEKDRDFLRFLWWPNGDLAAEPVQYRMTVHLFGAVSSPSCSNFALRKTIEDNESDFDSAITQLIRNNLYVDDCLASTATEEKAILLLHGAVDLCTRGGFHLTKWMSNSPTVIESVPEMERAKEIRVLDLERNSLPSERALGVFWSMESDTLGFQIQLKEKPPTRRGILAIMSSIYDPLGFVAPFVLRAKSLLQELCKQKFTWDKEIEGTYLKVWTEWLSQVPELERVKFERCYKSPTLGPLKSCQLHVFADASETGYGVVAYLRLEDINGLVSCGFVMGKSRVAPLKKITVPRLELTAATVATRLANTILQELTYPVNQTFYWTDSMSVLRYIRNRSCRFHTFVANRLAVIQEATTETQWKYVPTNQNPADVASRGSSASKLIQNPWWLSGPDFLLGATSEWPEEPKINTYSTMENDAEVKKSVNSAVKSEISATDRLVFHFSDWTKLKRITAWFLTGITNLRDRIQHKKSLIKKIEAETRSPDTEKKIADAIRKINSEILTSAKTGIKSLRLTLQSVQTAELAILKYIQRCHFGEELQSLTEDDVGRVKKSSSIFKLNPFVKDGLLRVGGRLQNASLPYDSKQPIVLPRRSNISRLIIEDVHKAIGHLGKQSVLAHLRQRFWIVGGPSVCKATLARCVVCKRYQGSTGKQKMANLPVERLKADEPPFTHVGMDLFGPILVKRGRTSVKRYGVLFTCMSIRAVHLELAVSLDTDSCVNAIRRFIARRGIVKSIRSDNGTNLVGAERELREGISTWNLNQINNFMLQRNIKWEFNPPGASHFGGVWERLIRSVRKILYSLMKEQTILLDDEALSTLFCEIEMIMNNRPLTNVSYDPVDLEVLTPNHLLLLRPGENFPPGVFNKTDCYSKRRWRQVQYLANIFWSRWIKEYLPLLQERQKWNSSHRNLRVGDVVLVVDSTPRNSWNLAKTIEVYPDKKGVVRSAKVKTQSGTLHRPIHKLCLILEKQV